MGPEEVGGPAGPALRPEAASDAVGFVVGVVPLAAEVVRVLVGARVDAHDDPAVADVALVLLRAVLGDARADERAHEAAGQAARARAGKGAEQRPRHDKAEAGEDHVRADGRDRADERAGQAADRAARARALERL